jgi:hypothetical protein
MKSFFLFKLREPFPKGPEPLLIREPRFPEPLLLEGKLFIDKALL